MDFTSTILSNHSKEIATQIADYVGRNESRFEKLIEIYLAGPYRITQRSAWPIGLCVERHPELILPHLRRLLTFIKKPGNHVAVARNTLRLLQFVVIPTKYQGEVVDLCVGFLKLPKTAIAIKVFAITVLGKIAQREPGIKNEIVIMIEDQLPYASPAFVSRASKVLKDLRR